MKVMMQTLIRQGSESLDMKVAGKEIFYQEGNIHHLTFLEEESGAKVELKWHPEEQWIELSREGDFTNHMTFQLGKETSGLAQTGQGNLDFQIVTHQVLFKEDPSQSRLAWTYILYDGGMALGHYQVQVVIAN